MKQWICIMCPLKRALINLINSQKEFIGRCSKVTRRGHCGPSDWIMQCWRKPWSPGCLHHALCATRLPHTGRIHQQLPHGLFCKSLWKSFFPLLTLKKHCAVLQDQCLTPLSLVHGVNQMRWKPGIFTLVFLDLSWQDLIWCSTTLFTSVGVQCCGWMPRCSSVRAKTGVMVQHLRPLVLLETTMFALQWGVCWVTVLDHWQGCCSVEMMNDVGLGKPVLWPFSLVHLEVPWMECWACFDIVIKLCMLPIVVEDGDFMSNVSLILQGGLGHGSGQFLCFRRGPSKMWCVTCCVTWVILWVRIDSTLIGKFVGDNASDLLTLLEDYCRHNSIHLWHCSHQLSKHRGALCRHVYSLLTTLARLH